jgi:hypothetical protein
MLTRMRALRLIGRSVAAPTYPHFHRLAIFTQHLHVRHNIADSQGASLLL